MNTINKINLSEYKVSPLNMIFLVHDGKVLTLKRNSDKKIYPSGLSGFGGKMEPGENVINSARREFLEETGLTVYSIELRGTFIRILDSGYINEMYLFIANGYEGKLKEISDEGVASWMDIDTFLSDKYVVDHIPKYLKQIIEGKDFYCGLGNYINNKMVSYTDNKSHFDERR